MPRYIYGADGSAQVVSPTGTPTTAPATVKSARTGGTTITDVLNMANANIAGIVTPDSRGQIIFQGPNNSTATYWLDFGDGGARWAVHPADPASAVTATYAALQTAEFTAPGGTTPHAKLPYTPSSVSQAMATLLDSMVTPTVASAALRDAAYPAPADGHRIYRSDLHAHQTYRAMLGSGASRWVTDMALIGEYNLTADTATVFFAGIPQEWNHLLIKYKARMQGSVSGSTKASYLGVRANSDTGSNYAFQGAVRAFTPNNSSMVTAFEATRGAASGVAAGGAANVGNTISGLTNFSGVSASSAYVGMIPGSDFVTLFGGGEITVEDYTGTTTRKAFAGRSSFGDNAGATAAGWMMRADLASGWSSNAAITRLDILPANGTGFAAGSRFSLYGLS